MTAGVYICSRVEAILECQGELREWFGRVEVAEQNKGRRGEISIIALSFGLPPSILFALSELRLINPSKTSCSKSELTQTFSWSNILQIFTVIATITRSY